MEQKIYKELLEWKNNADRKPLILQGGKAGWQDLYCELLFRKRVRQ